MASAMEARFLSYYRAILVNCTSNEILFYTPRFIEVNP